MITLLSDKTDVRKLKKTVHGIIKEILFTKTHINHFWLNSGATLFAIHGLVRLKYIEKSSIVRDSQ
jgi:hypothetical protein